MEYFPPKSTSSWRKAPALDPEDFAGWEMMFKAFVGYAEWELFRESEPQVLQSQRDSMVESDGSPTHGSVDSAHHLDGHQVGSLESQQSQHKTKISRVAL